MIKKLNKKLDTTTSAVAASSIIFGYAVVIILVFALILFLIETYVAAGITIPLVGVTLSLYFIGLFGKGKAEANMEKEYEKRKAAASNDGWQDAELDLNANGDAEIVDKFTDK